MPKFVLLAWLVLLLVLATQFVGVVGAAAIVLLFVTFVAGVVVAVRRWRQHRSRLA